MNKIFVVTATYDSDEKNYELGTQAVAAFRKKTEANKFAKSFEKKKKKEIDDCVYLFMDIEEVPLTI